MKNLDLNSYIQDVIGTATAIFKYMSIVFKYVRYFAFALLIFVVPVQSGVVRMVAITPSLELLSAMGNSKIVKAAKRNYKNLVAEEKTKQSKCYRAVKDTQINAGSIRKSELKGNKSEIRYAQHADEVFLRTGKYIDIGPTGFLKVTNPCMAPKGAILVYEGGQNKPKIKCPKEGCGHVETKIGDIGKGDMIFDMRVGKPVTGQCTESGRGYTLKSILILKKDYNKAMSKVSFKI